MSTIRFYALACDDDECPACFGPFMRMPPLTELRKMAAAKGWKVAGVGERPVADFCPAHKPSPSAPGGAGTKE